MHPVRKQRLLIVLFVVLFSSAAAGPVMRAERQHQPVLPAGRFANGKAPVGQPIRVGGMVVADRCSAATTAWR